jgi:hypothetical protein
MIDQSAIRNPEAKKTKKKRLKLQAQATSLLSQKAQASLRLHTR